MPTHNSNNILFRSRWLHALWLLPLFYALHHAAPDYLVISWQDVAGLTLFYSACAFVVYQILRWLWKQKTIALWHTLLLMALYLFWGYVYDVAIKFLGHSIVTKIPVLFLALIVLLSLIIVLLKRKASAKTWSNLGTWLIVVLLCYVVWDAFIWLRNESRALKEEKAEAAKDVVLPALSKSTQQEKIPVYILLFDALAGTKILNEHYHYNNSALDSILMQRGFYVNHESRSNYQSTTFSMASFLNARYLTIPPHDTFKGKANQIAARNLIALSTWIQAFHEKDYLIHNYSIFNFKNQRSSLNELFVLPVSLQLLNYNTFYGRIEWYLSRNYQSDKAIMAVHEHNKKLLELLMQPIDAHAPAALTYAHFMLPHLPYHYDSAGNLLPVNMVKQVTEADSTPYYLNQLPIVRLTVKSVVDHLKQQHQGKVIIAVMSDHGYGKHYTAAHTDLRYYNFSAVYFPDKNYTSMYEGMSNVNLSRVLLNKSLGTQLPVLPDTLVTYFDKGLDKDE